MDEVGRYRFACIDNWFDLKTCASVKNGMPKVPESGYAPARERKARRKKKCNKSEGPQKGSE